LKTRRVNFYRKYIIFGKSEEGGANLPFVAYVG